MNNQIESSIDSFERIKSLCNKNNGIWETYKPFVNSYAVFNGKLNLVHDNKGKIKLRNNGLTLNKKEKRIIISQICYTTAGRIRSMAAATNNISLQDKMNLSNSDLKLCRDKEFKQICTDVFNIAKENLALLADYEITEAYLNEFSNKFDDYSIAESLPLETKKINKVLNKNIRILIREIKQLLKNRLDIDIEYFRPTHPDFCDLYKEARKEIIYGIRHEKKNALQLSGTITDFETEKPITGAIIKIKDTTLSTISNTNGKFMLQLTKAGIYTLEATFSGYQAYDMEFEIGETESLETEIELEKEE